MKWIRIILIICLISLFVGCGKMTGSGTESDPYVIYDINDLQNVNNDLSAYYILNNDIDASGFSFTPIGQSAGFSGNFDGKLHTIDSLTIDLLATGRYSGLFGQATSAAVIKNISLTNFDYSGEGSNEFKDIGGIVGYAAGCEVTCCKVQGTIYISSTSTSYGISYIGGIAGRDCFINDCDADIDINLTTPADMNGGGIGWIGGIVGNAADINYCSAKGKVTTNAKNSSGQGIYIGGLGGYCLAHNSYSQVNLDVTGGDLEDIGGAIGQLSGDTSNIYSSGSVTISGDSTPTGIGGLIGNANGKGVSDSFWDTQTSGQSTSDGGTGKTTAEMYQQATYTNWDFDTIWDINEGNDYPFLRDFCGWTPPITITGILSFSFPGRLIRA